ncbi:MAG: alpha/beta hydrolase, partial [Bacteroidales bacterium]|nr:alpha/beta hydrolase [Bacteroidales bacterium]
MKILILTMITLSTLACNKEDNKPDYKFSGKYEVGGHKLYLLSYGQNKPTVILESGLGDGGTMSGWDVVQKEVKNFAQVCLYDRAGLGKSEKGPGSRTTIQIANELHALLESAKLTPPYILVGH